jgi:hypothetical protein
MITHATIFDSLTVPCVVDQDLPPGIYRLAFITNIGVGNATAIPDGGGSSALELSYDFSISLLE